MCFCICFGARKVLDDYFSIISDNRLYRQDREKLIQGAEKVISLKSVRRQVVCSVSILLGYVLAPLLMLFY